MSGKTNMEFIEIKAEVFRIVRANSGKTKKQISELLREQLPEVTREELAKALYELAT